MAVYPKTGNTPEAMIKILITIIDKTPSGGAALEDLKEAYSEAKGDFPTDRTIYRLIRRRLKCCRETRPKLLIPYRVQGR